jgi:hypothetical protein
MKVAIYIDDKEIENLKPFIEEIRFQKGVAGFVRQYHKIYQDLIKAKKLNK